jgi:hypothetical protein
MAFRLCAEAEAGGILVSGLVHELSGQDASRFVALGERRLKGFRPGRRSFDSSGGVESVPSTRIAFRLSYTCNIFRPYSRSIR